MAAACCLLPVLVALLAAPLATHQRGAAPKLYVSEMTLGEQGLPLRDVPVRYFVPDGACSGLLTTQDLGCGGRPPLALWVHTADRRRVPRVHFKQDFTEVIIRRSRDSDERCDGRAFVRLRVACGGRRSMEEGAGAEALVVDFTGPLAEALKMLPAAD